MECQRDELSLLDFTDGNCEEAGRGCRNKKKHLDPTCCPVCSVTLRSSEVDIHLTSEIEKLNRLPLAKHKVNGKNVPCGSLVNGNSPSPSGTDKNWETYQKVRSNRQTRQRLKSRKRKNDEVLCPICNKDIPEDITLHVEMCLRQSETTSESDETIDVEAYEEYEWAGQSRIRATSLLPGGVSSLGSSMSVTEEDEDLNVDVDDSQVYGLPQYSEGDVILPCADKEDVALRKAVTGTDPKLVKMSDRSDNEEENDNNKGDPVVEVLKARIRELENREQTKDIYKCLICMDRYRTPVISVCCWHVHCEQCWLQTLGAKKLCPQCNMITSPSDLRKIYM